MKSLLSLGVISLALACSSSTTTTGPSPAPTDTGTPAPAAQNPNGVAYPTTNLGYAMHDRIPNLKFMGYKATSPSGQVATTGTPQPVQLADFYNPDGKNGNTIIIHIAAGSRWCGPCNAEASAISGYDYQTNQRTGPGAAADLAPIGVVFVDALIDGFNGGVPATTDDLKGWINDHQVNFTQLLDPNQQVTNAFFLGASIPWNADIDARSMEILGMQQGSDPTTIESDLTALVNATKAKPPMQ